MKDTAGYIAVVVTLLGGLIVGSMRFASMETRLNAVESIQGITQGKLDTISAAVARIEGGLEEDRRKGTRRDGR